MAVLSGCFLGTECSLSPVCLRACPPCSLQLVSLNLFLSHLMFFSLHICLNMILFVSHLFPCLSPLFSPGSILNFVPNHCYSSGCLGKNGFPGLLGSSLLFFFVQVSLLVSQLLCLSLNALGRNLVYLLSFTLSSVSSTCCYPTCLPTCFLILSPLPCFFPGLQHLGQRGGDFCSSLSFITYLFL